MQEDGTQKGNGKRKTLSATYEPGVYEPFLDAVL
jgi:hypothetical protein